jgi:nicotinate-nucleotide adenylyltransferase
MKIGIFGGTFNPIHVGHAIIANYIIQNTDIDSLWFVVSPQNPLKQEYVHDYDAHRLRMAELVSRRLENVITSGVEFSLSKPSYTINTLNELQRKFPNDELTLIIGADNWVGFDKWKSFEEIINNYHIMIYPRVGYEVIIPPEHSDTITLVKAPEIEISSTDIRNGLKKQHNMCFYLTDDVYRYILENKLYQ